MYANFLENEKHLSSTCDFTQVAIIVIQDICKFGDGDASTNNSA